MKKISSFFVALAILSALFVACQPAKVTPELVQKDMERVAQWQMNHFRDAFSYKKPHHVRDWTNAALYIGMVKLAQLTNDDKYYNWLKNIGEEQKWTLHHRPYHADDHAVAQMYIELYRKYQDTTMINTAIKGIDYVMDNRSEQPITLDNYKHLERWTWCDALFMAPPVFAKLANVTGKEKYTRFMMEEYEATTQHLFDYDENLYYRDNSYIGKIMDDEKVFWARGNGWVFAGLCMVMDEYEVGTPEHNYFLNIYKKMAEKLRSIQTEQGHWSMHLLAADAYPTPETSGTGFYTYGFAWGINNGFLDRTVYEPVVLKGGNALVSHITEEGRLGYVQPIGAAPGKAWPDKTEVYGTGAFLSAGSELIKMLEES